jgi:hypothetical protein
MSSHPSNVHWMLVVSSELADKYMAMRHCIRVSQSSRLTIVSVEARHGLNGLERWCGAHSCAHKRRASKLVVCSSIGVLDA